MPYIVLCLEREGAERGRERDRERKRGSERGRQRGDRSCTQGRYLSSQHGCIEVSGVHVCVCIRVFVCVCVLEQVNKAITRTLPHASLSAIINYADNNAREYYYY